jgi:putative flavoprotein involved in K+ transport
MSQIEKWLLDLSEILSQQHVPLLSCQQLFTENCYWRDLIALTWNICTKQGHDFALEMLESMRKKKASDFRVVKDLGIENVGIECHSAHISFRTEIGPCEGIVRLVKQNDEAESPHQRYRCYIILTTLCGLSDCPEKVGPLRPTGYEETRGKEKEEKKIDVIILGAGQAGLTMGARLGSLGVNALLLEKNERIGDNWRLRFPSLHLHDPVWFDHFAFLPYPPNWPIYASKDKFGDWLESYSLIMGLHIKCNTTVIRATFNNDSTWTIDCVNENGPIQYHCVHFILATGISSKPNIPTFCDEEKFNGTILHSHNFHLSPDIIQQKSAIVVGSNNSAHDMAEYLHKHGASSVTMLQRSPTYVVRIEHLSAMLAPFYSENSPPTAFADLIFNSFPIPLLEKFHTLDTERIRREDAHFYHQLEEKGFLLNFSEPAGLFFLFLKYFGGYYIGTGASNLIIDGHIRVKHDEIDRFTSHGVIYKNGEEDKADIVVLATGYKRLSRTIHQIFGGEIADVVGEVWGLDDGYELRNIYRATSQQNLWICGGNLAQTRFLSQFVAIHIKAMLLGITSWPKK